MNAEQHSVSEAPFGLPLATVEGESITLPTIVFSGVPRTAGPGV